MSKLEYNPITGDLDKTGEEERIFGLSWDDGAAEETFEEMMERRVTALETALQTLLGNR